MATSCEPKRTSAYSEDLRWRMVYQFEGLQLSHAQIANNLSVDVATVRRTVKLFQETGNVSKKVYDKSNLPRKLTEFVQLFILQLALQRPGILLREIKAEVWHVLEVDLDESTICRFFHAQGFTRQKMQLIAKQRDELKRASYAIELSVYKPEMLIFLDETGCDRRNALRRYAYSWRGKPAKVHKLLVRGTHLNAIAFLSAQGILDCKIVRGTVDGCTFASVLERYLMPHVLPFDGVNPHSVVIMDNASIHHVDGIVQMIQDAGAIVLFLPPYSPDYNPIEEAFSKVKILIKSYEMDPSMEHLELEDIVMTAFCKITSADCQNWIHHCKIYNH